MQRQRLVWLLALPLLTTGSLAAHTLAYRIAASEPRACADLLETTGHGYLAAMPFLLAALEPALTLEALSGCKPR